MDYSLPPLKQSPKQKLSTPTSQRSPSIAQQALASSQFQENLQKRIDVLVQQTFSSIKQVISDRPMFVMNESVLECDPMTDYEIPKNILPLFEEQLAKEQFKVQKQLQLEVNQEMLMFFNSFTFNNADSDQTNLLLQRAQLAEQQALDQIQQSRDQGKKFSHEREKLTQMVNQQRQQINELERMGVIYKSDKIKTIQELQQQGKIEIYISQLQSDLLAEQGQCKRLESKLDQATAELDRLKSEMDKKDLINSTKLQSNQVKQIEVKQDNSAEYEAKINSINTNFLNFKRQLELACQENNIQKIAQILGQSRLVSRTSSREKLAIVNLNNQSMKQVEPEEIVDPFAGYGDLNKNNLAVPFFFNEKGQIIYFGKDDKYMKRVFEGKVSYLDTSSGRIYTQHQNGIWGYENDSNQFQFRNNEGRLFRILDNNKVYILDSQHRQIVPETYGKGEGRVYVTDEDLKYQIDQFNQPFISTDNKRIYLSVDTFEPYDPPFFRQYDYKMNLLEKFTQPLLPPKDVLMDSLGKRQHISEITQETINDRVYFPGTDRKNYIQDSLGFHYLENDNKYRVDSKGAILNQKQTFSFYISDNSLQINKLQFFFDENFGYFFCTDPENNRIALDQNSNQFMIVNHQQGKKVNVLKIVSSKQPSMQAYAQKPQKSQLSSEFSSPFKKQKGQTLNQIITGATEDGLIFVLDASGNKVIPAGKRKITVDAKGNYYEEIDGKRVQLDVNQVQSLKTLQSENKNFIEETKLKIAQEKIQQEKVVVNGQQYVVDESGAMFKLTSDGKKIEISGKEKELALAQKQKVEKLKMAKKVKVGGKTLEEGSDGEIYEVCANGERKKASKELQNQFLSKKDSQFVSDGKLFETGSDGELYEVNERGERDLVDKTVAKNLIQKQNKLKQKQVVIGGKVYQENSDGEVFEIDENGEQQPVDEEKKQQIIKQKQLKKLQKQVVINGQVYEEASDGEIYEVDQTGQKVLIDKEKAQQIRQKKHEKEQKQITIDGNLYEEGSDGEIYQVTESGQKQKVSKQMVEKIKQKQVEKQLAKQQKQIFCDGKTYEENSDGEVFEITKEGKKVKIDKNKANQLKQHKQQSKQTVVDGKVYETDKDGQIFEIDESGQKVPISQSKQQRIKQQVKQKQSQQVVNGKVLEEGADGQIYEVGENGERKLADEVHSKQFRQKQHQKQSKKLIKMNGKMMEVTDQGVIRYNEDGTTTLLSAEESKQILNSDTAKAQLAAISGETAQIGDKRFVRDENGEVFEISKDGTVKKLSQDEIKNLDGVKFTRKQARKMVIKEAVEDENGVKFICDDNGNKKILITGRKIAIDKDGKYVETLEDGTLKVLNTDEINEIKQFQDENKDEIEKMVKVEQTSQLRKKNQNRIDVEANGAVYEIVDGKKKYLTQEDIQNRNLGDFVEQQRKEKGTLPYEAKLSITDLTRDVTSSYKNNFVEDGLNFGCQVGVSFFNRVRKQWRGESKVMELSNRVNELLKSKILIRQSQQEAEKQRVDKNRQKSFVINLAQAFGGK